MTKCTEMTQIIRIHAGSIYHLDIEPPWWGPIKHLVKDKFCILCYGGKDLTSCDWQHLNFHNKDIAVIQYSEAFEDIMSAIEDWQLKNVTLITNNLGLRSTQNVSVHRFLWFEYMHTYHQENFVLEEMCNNEAVEKKFISLNGRRNVTRLFMIFGLKYRNLLDKGFVSLLPASWKPTKINNWRDGAKAVTTFVKDSSESVIIPSNGKFLENLVVDRNMNGKDTATNVMSNRWLKECNVSDVLDGPCHFSLLPMIGQSFFTVINETFTSNSDPMFFTEKTFKPMQYGHPFVLCGVPGALAKLRELGYKTFHPYIDESYDLEVDDLTRYVKILEQIKILCELDNAQLRTFLSNVRPIAEHNYMTLRDKTNWIYNERTLD